MAPRQITFATCDTLISFELRETSCPEYRKVLWLCIVKHYASIGSIIDPYWIYHVTSAAELPSLRGEWYFWDAKTPRRRSHEIIISSVLKIVGKMKTDLTALESASQQDMVGHVLIYT